MLAWLGSVVADVLQFPQFAPMLVSICRAACVSAVSTDVIRESAIDCLLKVVSLSATTSDVAEARRSALSALVEGSVYGGFAPLVKRSAYL